MFRVIVFTAMCIIGTAQAATLQDILDGHSKTLGSDEFRASINSLTYELEISEPTFEATAVYRATRAGQMRIDLYMQGQHVFTEAYDGNVGWQWNAGDPEPVAIDGAAAAALRHGLELPGHINTLLDLEARGHKLEYLGMSERYKYLLKVTLDDGHVRFYTIDPGSYLISSSRDFRAFHPDWDKTKVQVQTFHKDYKTFGDGWRKNTLQQNWDNTNDKPLGTTTVKCLQINMEVDPALFGQEQFESTLPVPVCSA